MLETFNVPEERAINEPTTLRDWENSPPPANPDTGKTLPLLTNSSAAWFAEPRHEPSPPNHTAKLAKRAHC